MDTMPATRTMSVLFVCHANRCRSPMAERLAELVLARHLAVGPWRNERLATAGITFASAGTHAYTGDPIHEGTLRVLTDHGASTRAFASRRIDETIANGSQLILTADRDQRAHCVRLAPASIRRTFTLREFGRLCGEVAPAELPMGPCPATRMRALVDLAFAARARFQPVPAQDDDLTDPVNRPTAAFQVCAVELTSILESVMSLVIVNPVGGRPR